MIRGRAWLSRDTLLWNNYVIVQIFYLNMFKHVLRLSYSEIVKKI